MAPFRKFHSIAALCGDGLRPELQALFERLAVDPRSELFERRDGMMQSGPDPVSTQAHSCAVPPGVAALPKTANRSRPDFRDTLKKFADN